jgi:sugar lactone lactonase YvrE
MNAQIIGELSATRLGEAPLWDANALIYVDIVAGAIHRHNFDKSTHETIAVEDNVGFAVIDTTGSIIAGIGNGSIYRFTFGTDERELLALPARDIEGNLANDGKCDRSGRIWCGTKNKNENAANTGSLARFDGGPKLTEVLFPVHISNGLAWSPDNSKLYYNDSSDVIWQFDYDLKLGKISDQRAFVKLPKDGSVPDGMTVDSNGSLYVAKWRGSRVDVYDEVGDVGKLAYSIKIPTALQISSVAFGGADLQTLFITSASVGLTDSESQRYPDSGRIFALRMQVAGLPEARFDHAQLARRLNQL